MKEYLPLFLLQVSFTDKTRHKRTGLCEKRRGFLRGNYVAFVGFIGGRRGMLFCFLPFWLLHRFSLR